uniref:Secreted protein n=1 Tax=Meloidogyne incognita TaxID=6306 RepID=A0A914MQ55_MELIC
MRQLTKLNSSTLQLLMVVVVCSTQRCAQQEDGSLAEWELGQELQQLVDANMVVLLADLLLVEGLNGGLFLA